MKSSKRLIATAFRVCAFVLLMGAFQYLYCELSRAWAPYGGTSVHLVELELPIFLALAWLFYVYRQRKIWQEPLDYLIALVPLLLVYVLFDGIHAGLHRSARFSDLANLGDLLAASPTLGFGAVLMLAAIVLVPALNVLLGLSHATRRRRLIWLVPRAVLVIAGLIILSSSAFDSRLRKPRSFAIWSDTRNIQRNGRITSVLYYSRRRAEALRKIAALDASRSLPPRFSGKIGKARNLHVMILESFIDPRLIKDIRIEGKLISEKLTRILEASGKADFDHVETPIYGGSTPQTEWEVLTGLPALAMTESVEFNALEGHELPSLCTVLKAHGYRCIASVAAPVGFFNSRLAYQSLGFDEVHFDDGKSYLKKAEGDEWSFDGDLFLQNLRFVAGRQHELGQPIFNYVIGLFGHTPFRRNLKKRPDRVKLLAPGPTGAELHRVVNQIHYRSAAVAGLIERLRTEDPDALLYLSSDHLPPIFGKNVSYSLNDRTNVSLFFDAGKRVAVPKLHSFEVSDHLWGALIGHPHPTPGAERLEALYLRALAIGMGAIHR